MPSNSSTNEKTVLSMVRQLPNDSWTYDKTALYVNFKNSVIAPDLSILDNYLFSIYPFIDRIGQRIGHESEISSSRGGEAESRHQ